MRILRYLMCVLAECKRNAVIKIKGQILRYLHPDLAVGSATLFRYDTLKAMRIGRNVNIGPFCEIVGIRQTSMSPVQGGLAIGNGTAIGAFANIRGAGGVIEIGENCMIAQHTTIVGANHGVKAGEIYCKLPYETERVGVRIGSNVWLGAGVVVLPGITIGDNVVVAAGAVVTRDIPANEVWGNIPARRLGPIKV